MSVETNRYSWLDHCILHFDRALQAIASTNIVSTRPSPASVESEAVLTDIERQQVIGMMRVNHVGEVCAQALYQGQAITARNRTIQQKFNQAAQEEQDHLVWCEQRITQLGGRVSFLNPVWYMTSLMLGVIAGIAGDAVNLGFLAETERQVERHLTSHLEKLPVHDHQSRAILEQMRLDEMQHAQTAEAAGAITMPAVVKVLMQCMSKLMTTTAYWV